MANYSEQMQELFSQYQDEVGVEPADLKVVGAWALSKGLWAPRPMDIQSQFATDMAAALRGEYRTDKKGRRYRAKLAVTKGRQGSLWGDIDTSPRKHVEKSVGQRRKQVVGDCHQLRLDVDHWNDANTGQEQLELILDFTDDVEEMLISEGVLDVA